MDNAYLKVSRSDSSMMRVDFDLMKEQSQLVL